MTEWITPGSLASLARAVWQGVRHRKAKRVAAEAEKIEWQVRRGEWCAFGASARTEKHGRLHQSFQQKSQDYRLLLSEEDYKKSGIASRTGLVAVRWRENGCPVAANARPAARDRKRGDGLWEVRLRRHL